MSRERDYTGVPTARLAEVYYRYVDVEHDVFAERIGMNVRQLKSIVLHQEYAFTGLGIADKILLGLGLGAGTILGSDELPVIPSELNNTVTQAKKMVMDELYALVSGEVNAPVEKDEAVEKKIEAEMARRISDDELNARAAALIALREEHCTPTAEQRARLIADAERSKIRQKKNSGESVAA